MASTRFPLHLTTWPAGKRRPLAFLSKPGDRGPPPSSSRGGVEGVGASDSRSPGLLVASGASVNSQRCSVRATTAVYVHQPRRRRVGWRRVRRLRLAHQNCPLRRDGPRPCLRLPGAVNADLACPHVHVARRMEPLVDLGRGRRITAPSSYIRPHRANCAVELLPVRPLWAAACLMKNGDRSEQYVIPERRHPPSGTARRPQFSAPPMAS